MDKKTDKKFTMLEALFLAMNGADPSKAIENQEKRGQEAVVRNRRLPKETNNYGAKDKVAFTKEAYTKMGIEIVSEYDDLFWSVKLPEGWDIRATDHSMWNELVDNKGRVRAMFFYKAAYYDRKAFINFETRFKVEVDHCADYDAVDYETWKASDYQGTVKDGDKVIYSTECIPTTGSYLEDERVKAPLWAKLEEFMAANYPDYEDVCAYWEE